ncbi:MAG: DUF4388 domain-containing protein [Deltaproteobacteria bacterium]|nr:DUF4388 domain-containing protein [Deltaproteobacteria bacterium]
MAATPSQFGEYRLGERLATSAVADVFVADANDGAGPTVVLKVFCTLDAGELPALSGRAQILDAADCDRLVLPTSWGVFERRVFLVRPAQPGVDLGQLLRAVKQRQAALSIELALTVVVDLLLALRALHSVHNPNGSSLYHGDVCAAHALVDDQGVTRLLGAETPRRSAGPSQRLDVAGAAALLYEVLNAGSQRRLPAAEQSRQEVLRTQFEPLFLQGLGLGADESALGAADFLTALKVQIDLAGIEPQRALLAELGRSFGLLRPDPGLIKGAPLAHDEVATPKPAPIDFGSTPESDLFGGPLDPSHRTEPFLSPFAVPGADEKTEVGTPASLPPPATAVESARAGRTRTSPPRADPAPRPEPSAPQRSRTPPPVPASRPDRAQAPATERATFDAAPTTPSPAAAEPPAYPSRLPTRPPLPPDRPPQSVVPAGDGRAFGAASAPLPAASPAFAQADTLPSTTPTPGPSSQPPARVATTAFEPDPRRLGEILVAMRVASQAQVDQALALKRQRGGHLGDLMLQSGAATEQDLANARGRQCGVPTITASKLASLKVSDQLLAALPEVYASAKRVLPVAFDPAQKCVTLLVVDPRDTSAITEARVLIAAQQAEVWVAPRTALEQTIRRLYAARGQEVTGDAGELLLLCTPNQTLAGSLKVRLVAEGFSVRHVTDGQVARDALEGGGIRGIVTELALPKVDGYNLILTTRSRDEYRDIPIFVFSSRADDYHMSKALELGADDFLPMPLNIDFLVSKLRRSIIRKPAAAPAAQQDGVGGSLAEMPLPEIVQTLELGRKTATVEIGHRGGVRGKIVFVDGQVVAATAADQIGEAAFYLLAAPREGSFHIRYGVAEANRNINNSTTFLLLEAMRRTDESR